jgi:serine kinase of HPr protein (carbohydrate metabolism regulator)
MILQKEKEEIDEKYSKLCNESTMMTQSNEDTIYSQLMNLAGNNESLILYLKANKDEISNCTISTIKEMQNKFNNQKAVIMKVFEERGIKVEY